MTYVIDIDGVVTNEPNIHHLDFKKATPNYEYINIINNLYNLGHTIIFNTSRWEEDRELTVNWMKLHKVNYNTLHMGKPLGDFYIDDKNMSLKEFSNLCTL